MAEHPIEGLMDTAMSNIKSMVDVNTIVGEAVTAPDGTIIIPVSTVSFGFGAGGSEFAPKNGTITANAQNALFGGGCGGGAKVKPVAFLVVGNGNVRLLPVSQNVSSVDKIVDMVPEMLDKVNGAVAGVFQKLKKDKNGKNENKEENTAVDVTAP